VGCGAAFRGTGWILCLRARVELILSGGLMLMGGGAGSSEEMVWRIFG